MGHAWWYPAGKGLPRLWLPHLMTHILGGIQVHLPTSRTEQQSLPHQPRQLGCRPQDTWRKRAGPGPGPPGGRGDVELLHRVWLAGRGQYRPIPGVTSCGWAASLSLPPASCQSGPQVLPLLNKDQAVWVMAGGLRWRGPSTTLPGMARFPSCPCSPSQLSAG